jgi:hypothetical protein
MAVALHALLKLVGNVPKDPPQKQVNAKIYEEMASSKITRLIHTEMMEIH